MEENWRRTVVELEENWKRPGGELEKNWRITGRVLEENWGMGTTGLARARHRWERVGLPPMPEALRFFNIGIIFDSYMKNKMLIRTTLPLIVQISNKTQKSNKTSTIF